MGTNRLGEAVLDLRADHKALGRDLDQAERKTKKSFGGMVGSAKDLRKGLLTGLAAGGATALIGQGIDAASDLQESLNKTTVTFGKSAKLMPGYGASVAEALGMSRQEALNAAAGIGSMLIPMGSSQAEAAKMSARMTTLAADLGSFHNADPTDMLQRLRAGLSGESEPLKQFGIVLSEARVQAEAFRLGIAEQGAELTDAQKIQARYSLAIRDAGKANGDFARTSDGLANQQRILKAEVGDLAASLGTVLLPAATGGVGALRSVVGFISDNQGNIEAAARVVRNSFAAAWNYVRQAVEIAEPHIREMVASVQNGVQTIRMLWERFGQHIVSVARAALGIVLSYVQGTLRNLQAVIALALALIRGDWSEAWAQLKAIVQNTLTMVVSIAKGIIAGLAPALGRLALAAGAAIGAGLWRGVQSRLSALAGVGAAAWGYIANGIASLAASVFSLARGIGIAVVSGVVQGIQDAAGRIASALVNAARGALDAAMRALGIGSPSRVAAEEIGVPLITGVEKGVMDRKRKLSSTLSSVVLAAVRDAQANLRGLTEDLAGRVGEAIDARTGRRLGVLDEETGPEAAGLRAMKAARDAGRLAEERARLMEAIAEAAGAGDRAQAEYRKAVTEAGNDPARLAAAREKLAEDRLAGQEALAEAHKSLAEWEADQAIAAEERRLAEARKAIEAEEGARKASAERSLANLVELFNAGLIKQADFAKGLTNILGAAEVDAAAAGELLGYAAGEAFSRAVDDVLSQSVLLGHVPGVKPGGAALQDPFATAVEEWRNRKEKLEKEQRRLKNATEKALPKDATPAQRRERAEDLDALRRINELLAAHKSRAPKRGVKLGSGGILSGPTYGLLAERGYPEAAVTLDGSSRSWRLLSRAAELMPNRGSGGGGREGPLVHIAEMSVRAPEDVSLVAARISRHLAARGVA